MPGEPCIKVEFTGLRSLQSSPVFIDGESCGEPRQAIFLPAGTHTIRVGTPPFCSQDLAVFLRPGDSILLLCSRSWLASVATLLLFGAIGCLLPIRTTGAWHPADALVLLAINAVLICVAAALGERWLELKQTQFHADDPVLRVMPGGVKFSSTWFPPTVVIDGRRGGALGEAICLSPGRHTVQVAGWTVSSNKLEHEYHPGSSASFTCRESPAAWAVLGGISAIAAASFIAMLWCVNHNRDRLGIEIFAGAAAFAVLFCTVISRFVPTMTLSHDENDNHCAQAARG